MRGLTLFRLSLLLPLVLPPIALSIGLGAIALPLAMASFAIGPVYIVLALWLARRLGRFSTYREAYIYLAKAPLILAAPLSLMWLLGALSMTMPASVAFESAGTLFLVLLGTAYLYVGLAALLVAVARLVGVTGEYITHD